MTDWTTKESEELYGTNYWGSGFFGISEKGNVLVTPQGPTGPSVDLKELTDDLIARGLRSPILIRFTDIVKARIQLLANCFSNAITEYNYKGTYCGVYPIKVNQQKDLVREIVNYGQFSRLGLECGSKPELLVVLAYMTTPNALVICNGFKDEEYIETAILSQKLGRNTIIVVDRDSELPMIINAAKKLGIRPRIGFRAKLDSQGAGKWVESSGSRSKFGLTAPEIVAGVEYLKQEGFLDSLELLHFHIGSQVASIQAVKEVLKEGGRYFAELCSMGAKMRYIDVGGGLGVDYDGSGKSDNSINYTEQEYANDVVSTIGSICDERSIPHPDIVTESGRALVAHHSVLIFNVIGTNELNKKEIKFEVGEKDHELVKNLYQIHNKVTLENLNEFYNDVLEIKTDAIKLYSLGYLSLVNRAKVEDLIWSNLSKMYEIAQQSTDYEELANALGKELSDTYYCNFSIFQSTPDHWAVDQLFPFMPIHRLNERPSRKAVFVDITCDSDGIVDTFIQQDGGSKDTLEVHPFKAGEDYFIGIFLVGAYQEILGDLHNLFGDTDAVHVTIGKSGYTVEQVIEGDTVAEVITYVQYDRQDLISRIRKATEDGIQRNTITKQEARLLLAHYESGLAGYTYLEDIGTMPNFN